MKILRKIHDVWDICVSGLICILLLMYCTRRNQTKLRLLKLICTIHGILGIFLKSTTATSNIAHQTVFLHELLRFSIAAFCIMQVLHIRSILWNN